MRYKSLLTILLCVICIKAGAYDAVIDGIYYNFSGTNATVTYKEYSFPNYFSDYSGDIIIPETVTYQETTYNVTSIGGSAFVNCSGLTSIKIPDNVATIGEKAFYGCNGLTTITWGNGVNRIENYAFQGCNNLTKIIVTDLKKWCDNSIIYIGYYNKPIEIAGHLYCDEETEITNLVIPESVTTINESAFGHCKGLISVTIPNSVTNIGQNAFFDCTNLESITFSNSVTSIGRGAFDGCPNLTKVIIPDIAGWCEHSITYEGYYSNPLSIAGHIYSDKNTEITNLVIPNNITSIGNNVFNGCSGLTSVTIPNNITSIGNGAFDGCSGLKTVTFHCSEVGAWFQNNSSIREIVIGDEVTSIASSAFQYCSGLQSVIIGNGVTSLPSNVFYLNKRLPSLTIGTGVLSIASDAFGSNKPIKTIWLTNTPPSGYTYAAGTVNYVANEQYTSLSNKTVYPFLSSMFEVDGVKYVPVSPSERTCDAIDCLYNEVAENINIGETVTNQGITMTVKQVHPYACFRNSYIKNVSLALNGNVGNYAFNGCTGMSTANVNNKGTIGNYAFQSCASLQTATLGENINGIGDYAFDNCSALRAIVIPNAVQTLGSYAFQGCSSMSSVQMGSGVTSIEEYTFSGCSSLMSMQVGSSVTTINNYAFYNCSTLPSIHIPQATTSIKNYVFSGCSSLSEVLMDDSETELTLGSNGSNPLFASCPLDTVYIGRNISYNKTSSYGYSPFYRNTSLRTVTITDDETEISENEFYGCTNLKNVRIGDGVTTIGNWAFSGCANLDYFAFGSSLQTIGKEAFSDCTKVTKIYSKASTPPTCGDQALDDINKWTCTLSVPTGNVASYQAAEQWKEFFYINENGGAPQENEGDPITITIKNCSRGYGEANPTFEYEVTGGDLEGTPSFSCTATSTSPVGTYQITGSKGSVTNSNVTFVSGVLTVTKAMLTVTADNCTMTQGGQKPELTLTYSGFKNDETASVLTTRPTASCVATSESNTGEYEITVNGGEAQNYDFTYVAGTLTIEPTAGKQLFASNITAYKGKQVEMSVSLTNEQTIAGFQFDLKLPTGISVAKSGNNYLASLTSRASGLDISVSKLESGDYRFVAFSNEANNISGNSGEVLTITLDIPQTATIGESTITIKNVVLTAIVNEASQSVYADNATSTLSVQNFTLGDTNGDGFINVTDVAGIVTHVSGQTQTNFNEIAADVNNDGLVDASDVTAEINTVKANASVGTGVSSGKLLYGNALSAYKGKQIVLPIVLENTQAMAGYQFDLQLPAGVSLATDGAALTERATGLTLYSNALATNQYRFVVVSTAGNTIATGNGAVMNLTLNVTDDAANGANTVAISNVILTAKSGNNVSSVYSDQANITLTVGSYSLGDVNGDDYINVTDVVCIVYDILGQTQTGFIRIAADVNNDGEVNITDVTAVVSMILSNEGRAAARGTTRSSEHFTVFDDLALKDDGDGTLSLHVDVPDKYVASQMEIHLAEGQTLKNISLNSHYKDSHQLVYDKVGRNCYRVLIFSMGNEAYPTDDDELIKIAVTGSGGDIEIREAVMVTSQKEQRFYEPISFYQAETATELVDVYSTDGRLVKSQAKDTSGLRKGVYIIKGKKVVVK